MECVEGNHSEMTHKYLLECPHSLSEPNDNRLITKIIKMSLHWFLKKKT